MGAKARHAWSVAQSKSKVIASKPKMATVPEKGSMAELYSYYSEMVKGYANGLKQIPDHNERNIIKASYLNTFREYLEEYMAKGETHDNNVLFYCLVWACDCQQWDLALELCDYAVKTVQHSDVFDRNHQTVFADNLFRFAEQSYKDDKLKLLESCHFNKVFERVMSERWDINGILKARYYKLKGLLIQSTEPALALEYYNNAEQLKPDIGVKTRIKELKELLLVK